MRSIGLMLPAVLALAGCAVFSPATEVEVSYPLPDGRQLEARYSSTKDIEAPSFLFERGPDGKVQRIIVQAGSSAASPVIGANAEQLVGLGSAIGAGVATGLRAAAGVPPLASPAPARPQSFSPASLEEVERAWWGAI